MVRASYEIPRVLPRDGADGGQIREHSKPRAALPAVQLR